MAERKNRVEISEEKKKTRKEWFSVASRLSPHRVSHKWQIEKNMQLNKSQALFTLSVGLFLNSRNRHLKALPGNSSS